MTLPQVEIILIASATALACSLAGVFLVLRRVALMSDAISHSILLGIVLAFFITRDLASPWLIIGAAATGLATVSLVELLIKTGKVRKDASIGLVFPLLFALGVILISRYAGDIHLDTDAVLVGELGYAPFDRWIAGGWDLGPRALWSMGTIAAVTAVTIGLFYKELKLTTFDAGLAAALGFSPVLVHYLLMALASITAVGAFNAVGSILVVALMIAPPAAAYLLTDRLSHMLAVSAVIGVACAVTGYFAAHWLDTSIAGSMAVASGLVFLLVMLLSPRYGLIVAASRKAHQRWQFATQMLAVHLLHHEGTPREAEESRVAHLGEHIGWEEDYAGRVLRHALRDGLVLRSGDRLLLTDAGRTTAREVLVQT